MFDEKFVPQLPGIEGFPGKMMHASEYWSAKGMEGKSVLVVGCGNSGMEIALDLAEAGAVTSIVVRGEVSSEYRYGTRGCQITTTSFPSIPKYLS